MSPRIHRFRLLLLAAISCQLTSCATPPPHAVRKNNTTTPPTNPLRVATYNIFVGTRDLTQTAQVVRKLNADILVLQEITPRSVVSRYPIQRARFEHSKKGLNGFLITEIDFHRQTLQIVDLHLNPLRTWTLPDKLSLPIQLAQLGQIQREELDQAFKGLNPNRPTLLLGDFNRTGDAALHHLADLGYIDSFAEVTPRPDRHPTLHARMLGLAVEKRIDFIFRDRHFRTLSSEIVPGAPSDHHAIASVFSTEPPR